MSQLYQYTYAVIIVYCLIVHDTIQQKYTVIYNEYLYLIRKKKYLYNNNNNNSKLIINKNTTI